MRARRNKMEIERENGVLILRDVFPIPGLSHGGAEGETVIWGGDKGCKERRQRDDICQVSGLVMEETTWFYTRGTQSYLRAGEARGNEKSGWQTDREREKRRKSKTIENVRRDEGDTKKEGSCGKNNGLPRLLSSLTTVSSRPAGLPTVWWNIWYLDRNKMRKVKETENESRSESHKTEGKVAGKGEW